MFTITFRGSTVSLKTSKLLAAVFSVDSLAREKHKICSEQREIERDVVRLIIQFYSSFWASCTVAFRGIPLSVQWFVIQQLSWV